jgi:hypothetical protein
MYRVCCFMWFGSEDSVIAGTLRRKQGGQMLPSQTHSTKGESQGNREIVVM